MLETLLLWGMGIMFGGIAIFAVLLFTVIFVVAAAEKTADRLFGE